jgi:lipopolysaccharide export system permease protein
MRLLDRYLLRELLVPLVYCLGGFLVLWTASDLFAMLNDFQSRRLLPADIAEYYLVSTPGFVVLVLPIVLLLSLLYTVTNHARHNEITAIRSAGISLWRLSLPYFGVGLLISCASLALNETWVPDSAEKARQIMTRRLPREPGALPPHQVRLLGFDNARDGRNWQVGVYDSITGEMRWPRVFWRQPDGSRQWYQAERAVPANQGWTFYNLSIYQESPLTNSLLTLLLQTNQMTVPAFTETPEEINSEVKIRESIRFLAGAKRADVPITEILNYLRLHPQPSRSDRAWLYTRLHGRLAAPWTCLVVVVIALPFAASSGRRNVYVGVASSIVICFAFVVLQQFGLALGTGGYCPSWVAAWTPNFVFGTGGLLATLRVR